MDSEITATPDRGGREGRSARLETGLTRREFLEAAAAAFFGGMGEQAHAGEIRNGMPFRTLGSTGEKVSIIGIGGSHIGVQDEEQESIRIIRTALDSGINFLDNSWDYNGGQSEIRMGKALQDGYRGKAFLMTKLDGRTKQSASRQLEESLRRLRTDHIDLVQFHEIIRMEDPDRIFAEDGAFQAMLDAKKAGKIRYIGFTGHKSPEIHLKMLDTAAKSNFHFDAVQMPLNLMDAHFESFQKKVLPVAVKERIGVLGMKPLGDKIILESNTVTPIECLHYAMSLPLSVVITGCDSLPILRQAIDAAKSFRPMDVKTVDALLARTAQAARNGKYELYKTAHVFDSTSRNPQWLG